MSKLSDDFKKFANKHSETHVKNRFFNKLSEMIKENKLTLASLNTELFSLTPDQRVSLFATKHGINSPTKNDAAELIRKLYAALGVKLNQHSLNILVSGQIFSEPQQKKLLRARYEQWRKSPLNQAKEKALLHELKGSLDLNSKENHNRSLPGLLLERWKLNHYGTLEHDLLTLMKQAPQYAPQLLELIYVRSHANEELMKQLLNAVQTDHTSTLLSVLYKSQPVLVTHWIMKNPAHYFNLTEQMRVAVLRVLEETASQKENPLAPNAQDTLNQIAVESDKIAEVKISELTNALLEGRVRQDPMSQQAKKLKTSVYNLVWEDAPELIKRDQIHDVMSVIREYLNQEPNKYKHDFFITLANDIKVKGLSIELLEKHLTHGAIDKNLLFAKWTGLVNSRAAGVMASIYQIASFGQKLSYSQLNAMVHKGALPKDGVNQELYIETKVKEVLLVPEKANASHLNRYIGTTFAQMQAKAQFLVDNQHKKQSGVEALYQEYLIEQGFLLASLLHNPIFDPQGHVTLFVTLQEGDYLEILKRLKEEKKEGLSAKDQVDLLLGSNTTQTTLCNLDIKNDPELKQKFIAWIGNDQIGELILNAKGRSSIIQLQQEMAMHVLLSLRVLERKTNEKLDGSLRGKLLTQVNQLVQEAFKTALQAAYSDKGIINMVILNRELDKARRVLAPQCRELLAQLVHSTYSETNWETAVQTMDKHEFAATTATGMDYLHCDVRNQTVTRISATEQTAHNKKKGAETQAIRVLYRNHYNPENGIVTPHLSHTMEIRVPSIADKETTKNIGIKDVAEKLKSDHQLFKDQATHSGGPIIYNLLTSLHTAVFDILPKIELQNQQRLSSNYILQGAHLYNLEQMRAGDCEALVYVQNIPVNQHTNKLDDYAFDDVTGEATIMTDIALLSTLRHHSGIFPYTVRNDLNNTYSYVHKKYLSFLSQGDDSSSYFHNTNTGVTVRELLSLHKELWNVAPLTSDNNDNLTDLAVKALFKVFSQNKHRNPQFGILVQTLSIFVEPMSQAGCKSANERYQAVSGRVDLLKSISSRTDNTLSTEEAKLKNALISLVNGKGTLEQLQECVDKAYNRHNLQGAVAAISMEDQGAGSKVRATQNKSKPGVITEYDTNVAESGFLTKLFQSGCSAMQSHKAKLADKFKALFQLEQEHIEEQIPVERHVMK